MSEILVKLLTNRDMFLLTLNAENLVPSKCLNIKKSEHSAAVLDAMWI